MEHAVTEPAPRYRILSSLDRGGMGEAVLADDTQLERRVAVKFLPDELQDDLLGHADAAASLFPLVLEALGTVTEFQTMELLQTGAGTAAAAGGRWEDAEERYRTALRQAHALPHRIAQPEVRCWYARMLLDCKASDDSDRARTLLDEAVEMYQQIGMPRHVEMAKGLLKSAL